MAFKGNFWKNPAKATFKPIAKAMRPNITQVVHQHTTVNVTAQNNNNINTGCGSTNHNFQATPDSKKALCTKCGVVIPL